MQKITKKIEMGMLRVKGLDLIFSGYIQLIPNTKRPMHKFDKKSKDYDPRNIKTLEEVAFMPDYSGILHQNVVLVDVDNMQKAEILLKILEAKKIKYSAFKTDKGIHFYFLNNNKINSNKSQACQLAIGITDTDIKLGSKNSLACLKRRGVTRTILKLNEDLDEIPGFLMPLKKQFNIDLFKLANGSRNNTLFDYINYLKNNKFKKDEIKIIIDIVNEFMLSEPLPQNEINALLRDEIFNKEYISSNTTKENFYIDDKFQHKLLANYLIEHCNIVKINQKLMVYDDGIYTDNITKIEQLMSSFMHNDTIRQRREVLEHLRLLAPDKKEEKYTKILLKNGVFDLKTLELSDKTPSMVFRNRINFNYNKDAYCELLDKTLSRICCNDKQLRQLLEEFIGLCLLRTSKLAKFAILTGSGGNGKSTFLKVLCTLLGDENYTSFSLQNLSEMFTTCELEGKLANIDDDLPDTPIKDSSIIKKLTGGSVISARTLHQKPFQFVNYATMIFSANKIPPFKDNSDGIKRRLLVIPFNARFSIFDKNYDPFLEEKITKNNSMEYFLRIGIDGIGRVLAKNQFTIVDSVEKNTQNFFKENNSVLLFLDEDTQKIVGSPISEVYFRYKTFCLDDGYKAMSKNNFSKIIRNELNLTTKSSRINGRVCTVYIEDV